MEKELGILLFSFLNSKKIKNFTWLIIVEDLIESFISISCKSKYPKL